MGAAIAGCGELIDAITACLGYDEEIDPDQVATPAELIEAPTA